MSLLDFSCVLTSWEQLPPGKHLLPPGAQQTPGLAAFLLAVNERQQGHFRWPHEEKLNNRRKQVLNYPPRRGEPGTRQERNSCLSGISPPLTSHKHEEPPWNTPSCQSRTLVCSGWLKDSKIIFQSMFVSLHKEFRMSLKVKYSALQKAGQQGMVFFFFCCSKNVLFYSRRYRQEWNPYVLPLNILQKFWANHTPDCSPMSDAFNSQISLQVNSKVFFFPFLKKRKKEILELAFTENKVNRETYYNLVFNFIFLNLFIFFPQRERGY